MKSPIRSFVVIPAGTINSEASTAAITVSLCSFRVQRTELMVIASFYGENSVKVFRSRVVSFACCGFVFKTGFQFKCDSLLSVCLSELLFSCSSRVFNTRPCILYPLYTRNGISWEEKEEEARADAIHMDRTGVGAIDLSGPIARGLAAPLDHS
ncbi:hypothetical protein CEXT_394941 [Caerostris extrusa]|uniref:Uncharacterized protein n=1 Tax=Caerostris extrusa TaxID=172846 RepID=A0AAV4XQK2_CAEEX|nr:hypothetical protein CEXT_394941 [Caerostris extrusa]